MKIQNKVANTIYAGVMLAPMVSMLFSCAYSIFNKNATEQMTRTEVTNPTNLVIGNTYEIDITTPLQTSDSSASLSFENIEVWDITGHKTETTNESYFIYYDNSNGYVYAYEPTGTYWDPTKIKIRATLAANNNGNIFLPHIKEIKTYTETRDLRNTFYYSLDRVQEENVFKWANNSPFMEIYTPFVTFFGVTDSTLPFLLSYWTSVSLVMFGYEIITFMVSFARNLMHKFEDKAGGF